MYDNSGKPLDGYVRCLVSLGMIISHIHKHHSSPSSNSSRYLFCSVEHESVGPSYHQRIPVAQALALSMSQTSSMAHSQTTLSHRMFPELSQNSTLDMQSLGDRITTTPIMTNTEKKSVLTRELPQSEI